MENIVRSLSKVVDANGYAQILLFVHVGRKIRMRIKSGVFIPCQYWNNEKQIISILKKKIDPNLICELQSAKEKLDVVETRILKLIEIYGAEVNKKFIEETIDFLKDYDGTITKEVIDNLYREINAPWEKKKAMTVFSLIDTFFSLHKLSEGRKRFYKVLFRTMARYQLYSNAIYKDDFSWNIDTTTKEDIENFFDYLENECTYRIKMPKIFEGVDEIYKDGKDTHHKKAIIEERGGNRIVCMKKGVNAFWNWLLKEERTTNAPLRNITIGAENYGTPFFLTKEERNKIANFDLSKYPNLAVQRDIFIFHCFVGCRVGDLMKLTKNNIEVVKQGKEKILFLVYDPTKTKNEKSSFSVRVPLSEIAISLIEKYKGIDSKHRLFPFVNSVQYNLDIKEIIKKCKIERMVIVRNSITGKSEMKYLYDVASSHMARRTFIGNAYKVVQDPNLIGKMSGHVEGSKAFARYRNIDDEMLTKVVNAIS